MADLIDIYDDEPCDDMLTIRINLSKGVYHREFVRGGDIQSLAKGTKEGQATLAACLAAGSKFKEIMAA